MARRSAGFREPLPAWWPGPVRDLLSRCWAQDPEQRPSFPQVLRELRALQADGVLGEMDRRNPAHGDGPFGCGCVIS